MRIHEWKTKGLLFLLPMMMAACSADELIEMSDSVVRNGGDSQVTEEMMPVPFLIGIDEDGSIPLDSDAATRAGTGVQASTFAYATSAESWSKVGLFWDKGDNTAYTAYVYNTTANSTNLSGNAIYFASSSQTMCNIYGVYPYDSSNTASFSIQTNQATDVNYAKSDLLLITAPGTSTRSRKDGGTTTWNDASNAAVTFKHVMAKMILNVTAGTGVTISKVELLNVMPTVDFTTTGNNTTTDGLTRSDSKKVTAVGLKLQGSTAGQYARGSAGAVTVHSTSFTNSTQNVAAVIPPQNISGNFIKITTTAGDVYYDLGSTAKTFTGGQTYTVTLNVTQQQVGKTVSISGWNPSANSTLVVNDNSVSLSATVLEYDWQTSSTTKSNVLTATSPGSTPDSYSVEVTSGSSATATITNAGVVSVTYGSTSKSAGTTVFKVTSKKGSQVLGTASFAVVVKKIAPTITFSASPLSLSKSGTTSTTVSVTGGGTLSYGSISNSNIATYTKSGNTLTFTAKTTKGSATVQVTAAASANYLSATATLPVYVDYSLSAFSLSQNTKEYTYNGNYQSQSVTISGVTGSGNYTITSSNSAVCSLSSNSALASTTVSGTNFTIYGHDAGTALITVTKAADANYLASSKTIAVTVNQAENEIHVSGDIQHDVATDGNTTSAITISDYKGTLSVSPDDDAYNAGITPNLSGNQLTFTV